MDSAPGREEERRYRVGCFDLHRTGPSRRRPSRTAGCCVPPSPNVCHSTAGVPLSALDTAGGCQCRSRCHVACTLALSPIDPPPVALPCKMEVATTMGSAARGPTRLSPALLGVRSRLVPLAAAYPRHERQARQRQWAPAVAAVAVVVVAAAAASGAHSPTKDAATGAAAAVATGLLTTLASVASLRPRAPHGKSRPLWLLLRRDQQPPLVLSWMRLS